VAGNVGFTCCINVSDESPLFFYKSEVGTDNDVAREMFSSK
jgi:hypothetical protein